MSNSTWQLQQHEAHLRCGELTALVDLRHPQRGLHSLAMAGAVLPGASVLAVELPAADSSSVENIDGYARGADLVVTYAPRDAWPFRTQIYWRARSTGHENQIAGIELVASVQTDALDSRPYLFASSRLPASDCRRLSAGAPEGFAAVQPSDAPQIDTPRSSRGCSLLQLPGGACYAEMVHPLDFEQSELSSRAWERNPGGLQPERPSGPTRDWLLRHRLFGERLEKGVILRARVLAVWLRPPVTAAELATLFEEFSASEPPLTT